MATTNAINANSTGLVKYNGTGTFSGVTVTQYNALIGGSSNAITSVAPSTTGIPLVSQGAAADPVFGTAVVAAGGTNLTTYASGDIIYASSATVLSKLAKGTDTHVLTVASSLPSWAAPTAGGGVWTFLASGTAAASATLDFTTGINSTYNCYAFVIDSLLPVTSATNLYMRTSTDGGSTYDAGASDYGWAKSSNANQSNDNADSEMSLGDSSSNSRSLSGIVYVYSPSDALPCNVIMELSYTDSVSGKVVSTNRGIRFASANVDAVRFLYSSGNINTGVIYLYGISKTS